MKCDVSSLCRADTLLRTVSDFLAHGSDKEKKLYYKENGNDIKKIQERLEKLAAEVRPVKRKAI